MKGRGSLLSRCAIFVRRIPMLCPNCRKEIAEYSNFCSFCGARQAEVAAARRVGPKRLMRSSTDSKMGGVCGGLAEYFEADPGIVRILVTLLTIASGFVFGILSYVVAWIILPLAPAPFSTVASHATAGEGSASPSH
jgi:phage shock protein C